MTSDRPKLRNFKSSVKTDENLKESLELRNKIELGSQEFVSSLQETEKRFYWIAVFLKILCYAVPMVVLIVYYVLYFLLRLPFSSLGALGGAGLALILFLIFKLVNQRLGVRAGMRRGTIGIHGLVEDESQTRRYNQQFLTVHSEGLEDDALSRLSRFSQLVISAARQYWAAIDKYYNGLARINKQLAFIKSFKNALAQYGVKLSEGTEGILDSFASPTNSEAEWLVIVIKRFTSLLSISRSLLSLFYHDFVEDLEQVKNDWDEISKDDTTIMELATLLIQNNVVDTSHLSKSEHNYLAMKRLLKEIPLFRLAEFRREYDKLNIRVAQLKADILDALRQYNINPDVKFAEVFQGTGPATLREEAFVSELLSQVAGHLEFPLDIVRLMLFDRQYETLACNKIWNKIKSDKKSREAFAQIIVDNQAVDVPPQYCNSVRNVIQFIIGSLVSIDYFSLSSVRNKTKEEFGKIELLKRTFLGALLANNINVDANQKEDFENLLVPDLNAGSISSWLQDQIAISSQILLLFYYDYVQDTRLRRDIFRTIVKSELLSEFASVLLSHNIVLASRPLANDSTFDSDNLGFLLTRESDYDRSIIQVRFFSYNQLMMYSDGITEFLKTQKIIEDISGYTFREISLEVKTSNESTLQQLFVLLSALIRKYASPTFNSKDWHQSITTAILALYLVAKGDILQAEGCRLAGSNHMATQILYQFSRERDEEERKGITQPRSLNDVIAKTMDGTFNDYEYIDPFRKELASGFLFQRISHLLYARLQAIDKKITDKSVLEENIRKYSTALNTFLNSKLQANMVLESLRMQLVNAYVITNPSGADVITGIIDTELPAVCNELAVGEKKYENFLMISDKLIGRGTRVGIVPFNSDFESFGRDFDRIFNLATDRHRSSTSPHTAEEYYGNIIRIFPAESYFHSFGATSAIDGDLPSDHPVHIIRQLVLEHYGTVENLELIASLQGDSDKTLAMKSVVSVFYDTIGSLYLTSEARFKGILANSKVLDHVKSGELDHELMTHFDCASRSGLALTVYKSVNSTSANASPVRENLCSKVSDWIRQIGGRIGQDSIDRLCDLILDLLYDMGMILQGLQ